MRKALRKYAKQRFRKIIQSLESYRKNPNQETIHRIRVEIKNLKALLRLLRFHDAAFPYKKTWHRIRKLHRACGHIRDPYVLHVFSEKYAGDALPHDPVYHDHMEEFKGRIADHVKVLKKQRKNVLRAVAKVNARSYRKYLRTLKRKVRRNLTSRLSKQKLHVIRKRIKEIIALSGMTRKKGGIPSFYLTASDLLGDWHDKEVLRTHLKNAELSRPETLANLENHASEDLKRLRDEVRRFYQ